VSIVIADAPEAITAATVSVTSSEPVTAPAILTVLCHRGLRFTPATLPPLGAAVVRVIPEPRRLQTVAGARLGLGTNAASDAAIRHGGKDATIVPAPAGESELGQDVADVRLDCLLAQPQVLADRVVGQPPGKEPEDLTLALRQFIKALV
jgi:hypothetical protein